MVEQTASIPTAEVATPVVASAPVESVTVASPAVVETPQAPVVTEAAKEPVAPSTALGTVEKPKEAEKPVDVKTGDEAKTADAVEEPVVEAEPAQPVYEAFKLPEGITIADDKLGDFTKMLGELELGSKYDHAKIQEFGQKLLDRHLAETKDTVARLQEAYQTAFDKQGNDWKEAFQKDPEIGGNRQETTVNAALEFIRRHGGTEAQQTEFRNLMETTKVGNHPAMIRMLAKANMAMSEGKPLAAQAPSPAAKSRVQAMYGSKRK